MKSFSWHGVGGKGPKTAQLSGFKNYNPFPFNKALQKEPRILSGFSKVQ